ncbi:hypothetical protein PENSPDRAFT_753565 [Peniophora sp. CONT]|nr:hypothetical protein PENSPDRAFT_753565 [Peniophora sp. CONT]
MSPDHYSLISSRNEFDAWITTGVEHFQKLSLHCAELRTVYGASLAVKLLNEEYNRRVEALRRLHDSCAWLRNGTLSPLVALPLEIQRHILTMATYGRGVRSWVKLGHICSELRHTLLNIQNIWADSVCDVSRARNEIARRAGDTPLVLNVRTSGSYDLAFSRLSSARRLDSEKERFILKLLEHLRGNPNDLSQLEVMTLKAEDDFMLSWNEPTLPTLLCPRLVSVSLANIHVILSSASLTHLTIEDALEREGPSYSPTELLTILRSSPHLRVIKLRNSLPDFMNWDHGDGDVISLNFLEKLNVSSQRVQCLLFWSHIVVPETAEVAFNLNCREDTPTAHRSLRKFEDASFLKRHIRDVSHSIVTITGGPQRLVIAVRTPQRLRAPGHTIAKTLLSLTYDSCFESLGINSADEVQPAVRCVRDALGLSDIEDLAFGRNLFPLSSANNHTTRWHAILHLFPAVEYLTVTGLPSALCAALRLPGPSSPDETMQPSHPLHPSYGITPALPRLQHLSVGFKSWHETRPLLAATDLAGMVQERTTLGMPLRTLVLENIRLQPLYVVDSFVSILRPLVPFLQTMPSTCESLRCIQKTLDSP